MNKLYVSRALKLLALAIPLVLTVLLSQHFLFYYLDFDSGKVHDYGNEEPNSLDVVFLGASDVFSGFSPADAYDQYGFTSFLYTLSSNTGLLYKNMLKEIMKTQTPSLFVVEIEGFIKEDEDELTDESRLRLFTEGLPFSLNEIDAILHFPTEDKLSHFLPFVKYHGDWWNLNTLRENLEYKTTGYDEPSLLKGMYTETRVCQDEHLYDIAQDRSTSPLLPLARESLIDFLEFLKEERIENVLFVRFPHMIADERYYERFQRANDAQQIIEQYGFAFRNFEYEVDAANLQYKDDFYNADHLNIYGARKFTAYLGGLLVNEYGVVPRTQSAENKAHWETCSAYNQAYFATGETYYREGKETSMFDFLWFMTVLDEKVEHMQQEAEQSAS